MLEVVLASAADLEPQFDWPGVSVLAIVNLGLHGVLFVLPHLYVDPEYKDYGVDALTEV